MTFVAGVPRPRSDVAGAKFSRVPTAKSMSAAQFVERCTKSVVVGQKSEEKVRVVKSANFRVLDAADADGGVTKQNGRSRAGWTWTVSWRTSIDTTKPYSARARAEIPRALIGKAVRRGFTKSAHWGTATGMGGTGMCDSMKASRVRSRWRSATPWPNRCGGSFGVRLCGECPTINSKNPPQGSTLLRHRKLVIAVDHRWAAVRTGASARSTNKATVRAF